MSSDDVRRTAAWIRQLVADDRVVCEFRTTVHPELLTLDEIKQTARQIRGAELYVLQNYKPVPGFMPSLQWQRGYGEETLRQLADNIRREGIVRRCIVRGYEGDA